MYIYIYIYAFIHTWPLSTPITKIWIWCHPAIFQEAFDEFRAVNEYELDINCVPGGLLRFNVRGRESLLTLNKVLKTLTDGMYMYIYIYIYVCIHIWNHC
jgi:hypothetical protein